MASNVNEIIPAESVADHKSDPRDASLDVGRRFFESRPPHHVWIVSKVYTPPASKLPHVLLDRCGKFPASKLISVTALKDTNFFKKDRRDPFGENSDKPKLRRTSDPTRRP